VLSAREFEGALIQYNRSLVFIRREVMQQNLLNQNLSSDSKQKNGIECEKVRHWERVPAGNSTFGTNRAVA
jgi:hypothetical protein